MEKREVKRGEVFYADLSPVVGSEQGGVRPVLIVQNDIGNRFSPTVIAAAITSKQDKTNLPTHIPVKAGTGGLSRDSVVLLEQIRTLDKHRLRERAGRVGAEEMRKVDAALGVSFGRAATCERCPKTARPRLPKGRRGRLCFPYAASAREVHAEHVFFAAVITCHIVQRPAVFQMHGAAHAKHGHARAQAQKLLQRRAGRSWPPA